MNDDEQPLKPHAEGVMLSVQARGGARRDVVQGIHAGMLRVCVTAPPEKGKANQAIVALLAKVLGVSRSSIELVSGATSPRKRLLIRAASMDEVSARIDRALHPE